METPIPSIPATTNVGFAKRLVLDSPPVAPVNGLLWSNSSRCHNILNTHARNGWRPRGKSCRIGRRSGSGSQSTKIDYRNGSCSSFLRILALSTADRRVSPVVLVTAVTGSTATAAAGSRAPLGDPVLLFELF